MSLNKAQLIGNLGRDAELKYTPSGQAVSTINVATTEIWNDKNGQKQERTEWHRCIIWGKTAENLSEYLVKGKQVYVEGRIQTRQWEDKDGIKRYTTEIKADRVQLLGGPNKGGGGSQGSSWPSSNQGDEQSSLPPSMPDDDIPFGWAIGFIVPATFAAHFALSVLA